jgi:hypothetical protein
VIKARIQLQVELHELPGAKGVASVTIEAQDGAELATKVHDVRTVQLLQDALEQLQRRVLDMTRRQR